MQEHEKIRLLLADSQPLLRDAVRSVLSTSDEIVVVAEAGSGHAAVEEARRVRPDVALIDVELPNPDGVATARQILRAVPRCSVLLSASNEDPALLLSAIEAGVSGFITRAMPLQEFVEATRSVHRGETVVPSHMLRPLLARLVDRRRDRDIALRRMGRLTRREREVLGLLSRGVDNEGIALALVISPETVRTHIQNVRGKLEVHSRLEAATFVMRGKLQDDLERVEV